MTDEHGDCVGPGLTFHAQPAKDANARAELPDDWVSFASTRLVNEDEPSQRYIVLWRTMPARDSGSLASELAAPLISGRECTHQASHVVDTVQRAGAGSPHPRSISQPHPRGRGEIRPPAVCALAIDGPGES